MDSPSSSTLPGSENVLGIAANLLCDGDFASCRKFAHIALNYDPENLLPARILAVADVLLAEKSRDPTDWYPILQLTRPESENRGLVRTQFEKLTALLNPDENCFPFSGEALGLVKKAWAVLSDPEGETRFGNGPPESPKGLGGETFWTVCPYCYCMFEYKKMYEECCLRCQVCRKAFHGAAIRPPAPEILVPGKEEYYFSYGCFPMEYDNAETQEKKKSSDDEQRKNKVEEGVCVVEISDDDEEEEVVKNVKAPVKRMKAAAGRRKGMRSKTVVNRKVGRVGLVDLNVEGGNWNGEMGEDGDVLVGFGG